MYTRTKCYEYFPKPVHLPGGRGTCTLIFSYILRFGPFVGVQNFLNFNKKNSFNFITKVD